MCYSVYFDYGCYFITVSIYVAIKRTQEDTSSVLIWALPQFCVFYSVGYIVIYWRHNKTYRETWFSYIEFHGPECLLNVRITLCKHRIVEVCYYVSQYDIKLHVAQVKYPILDHPFYIPDVLCDPINLIWRQKISFEAMTGSTAIMDGLLSQVFRFF